MTGDNPSMNFPTGARRCKCSRMLQYAAIPTVHAMKLVDYSSRFPIRGKHVLDAVLITLLHSIESNVRPSDRCLVTLTFCRDEP